MTPTRPPDRTEHANRPDDLKQRYLQASAQQAIGPNERVRSAALAHAQAQVQIISSGTAQVVTIAAPAVAANRSRWNIPMVASLAIASFAALLALQFDRGDSQDKQVALGERSATNPAVVTPPPAPAIPSIPSIPSTPAIEPAATSTAAAANAGSTVQAKPAAKKEAATRPPQRATAPTDSAAASKPQARADVQLDKAAPDQRPAVQSKSAQTADAAGLAPDVARGESSPQSAASSSPASSNPALSNPSAGAPMAPAAANRSRAAKELMGESRPPASAAAFDAGASLREAARTGQAAALAQALQTVSAAHLNSTDSAGRTALILATSGGHVEAVQRLVAAGADTTVKDASGQTAEQLARRLGYKQIESILKSP